MNRAKLNKALLDGYYASNTPAIPISVQRLAKAYSSYASEAISCSGGSPVSLLASEAAFIAAMTPMLIPFPNPLQYVNALSTGLVVFWTPVIFTGVVPGAVTNAPLIKAAAQAALIPFIALRKPTKQKSANTLATALDTASRIIIVAHPIVPTPCVGPIA